MKDDRDRTINDILTVQVNGDIETALVELKQRIRRQSSIGKLRHYYGGRKGQDRRE